MIVEHHKKIIITFLFKNFNVKYKLGVCTGYPVSVCKPVLKYFFSRWPAVNLAFFNEKGKYNYLLKKMRSFEIEVIFLKHFFKSDLFFDHI